MIRLACVVVLLLWCCGQSSAQYPYQYGSGCTGGQVSGQYLGGMPGYGDVELARYRQVYRSRGYGYTPTYSYAPTAGYGYYPWATGGNYATGPFYGAATGYGYSGYGTGVPTYPYSLPPAVYGQPIMQCGPNGCSVIYR